MAENSSSDAQPANNNENTANSARGAHNRNNNNRRQRPKFKGLYNEKFNGLTITSTDLNASHYQKFKSAVLALVMTETTEGRNLYDDIINKTDTWTNRAEPARDDTDKMNTEDIKHHRREKRNYLNNTLTMAMMIIAQCDDHVTSLLKNKSGYDTNHMSAVWVMQALHEFCSGVKPEEHPIEGDLKVFRSLLLCKQYDRGTTEFHEQYKEAFKALELRGCGFKVSSQARAAEKALNKNLSDEEADRKAQERLVSLLFLYNLKEKPVKLYAHLRAAISRTTTRIRRLPSKLLT